MIKLLYEKIFIVILFVKYFLPELIEDIRNKTLLLNSQEPPLVRPDSPPIYFAQSASALPAGRTHYRSLMFLGPVSVASRDECRH